MATTTAKKLAESRKAPKAEALAETTAPAPAPAPEAVSTENIALDEAQDGVVVGSRSEEFEFVARLVAENKRVSTTVKVKDKNTGTTVPKLDSAGNPVRRTSFQLVGVKVRYNGKEPYSLLQAGLPENLGIGNAKPYSADTPDKWTDVEWKPGEERNLTYFEAGFLASDPAINGEFLGSKDKDKHVRISFVDNTKRDDQSGADSSADGDVLKQTLKMLIVGDNDGATKGRGGTPISKLPQEAVIKAQWDTSKDKATIVPGSVQVVDPRFAGLAYQKTASGSASAKKVVAGATNFRNAVLAMRNKAK